MTTPLAGLLVVELGERLGVSVCTSFLAQSGAEVVFLEGHQENRDGNKWRHRDSLVAGKLSCRFNGVEDAELVKLLQCADVIVTSSDMDSELRRSYAAMAAEAAIVCDMTAFGSSGPLAGQPYTDAMVQAVSGLMAMTGYQEGSPCVSAVPLLENSAGLYAAAAVMAAIRVRRFSGHAQQVEVALYDCAINFLTTFLPVHYEGRTPSRLGNGHSLVVPWNSFDTADGMVQLCSVTDRQWQQLCGVISRPDLAENTALANLAGRVEHRREIDQAIQAWTSLRSKQECVQRLNDANIACGEVLPTRGISGEPNLQHRNMVLNLKQPTTNRDWVVPASPIKTSSWQACSPTHISAVDEDHQRVVNLLSQLSVYRSGAKKSPIMPLSGIRVIEIGQFTNAPLTGKTLASLGAEVIKIEPPGGDAGRQWAPHRHDVSYYFMFTNSDKLSIEIDLTSKTGADAFRDLIRSADVLLENMKPGSLARLGFDEETLTKLNPQLIYCPISGFGKDSIYPNRPAFDTVVQAMSGIMDMTRDGKSPIKCGPSVCDVSGGQLGLVAIMAALELRDQTGEGTHFDLSMQDISAFFTQTGWNDTPAYSGMTLQCIDGYVYAEAAEELARITKTSNRTCEDCIAELLAKGIQAVPVMGIAEVAGSGQTSERELIYDSEPIDDKQWPLFRSPINLSLTPARIKQPVGEPQALSGELRKNLGLTSAPD